jgi:TetR/AcrR family transcriptional repressor of nem operon
MIHKGYTAVGLAEVVAAAGVPKGSFYYYFKSKEEFGQALLEEYFSSYLATVDAMLTADGSAADRLRRYFHNWAQTQGSDVPDNKCLMVKLGSEVCDLSEDMRLVLKTGSEAIIERLARCIEQGQLEGSVQAETPAAALAQSLYQLWLGASLLAKVSKDRAPFDTALIHMERLLS